MKSNEALIKHVLLDYALIIPKRLEASSLELKEEDYQNLDAIKNTVLYKSNQGHSKHIIAKILIAAVIAVSILATLIACVKPLRNFFIEIFDVSIDITGSEPDQVNKKSSIEEIYIPTLIDNMFESAMKNYTENNTYVVWITDNAYIIFQQLLIDGTFISIDQNENSNYNYESIDGQEIFFTVTDGAINITWSQYGYIFNLLCPESLGWDFIEEAITSLEIVDVPIESVE